MTLLIASIAVGDVARLDERAGAAFDAGADAVELRVDGIDGAPEAVNAFLRDRADRRWIVTLRSRDEGGSSDLRAVERAEWLARAVQGVGAYVDFEYAAWRDSPEARDRLKGCLRACKRVDERPLPHGRGSDLKQCHTPILASHEGGKRLILSAHRFDGPFDDAESLVRAMLAEPEAAVAKIAYTANDIRDSFVALDLMEQFGSRVIALAMGEDGLWTRVLAKKLGAFGSYASLDASEVTAPGQLTVDDMVKLFRWNRVDRGTRVFGVIGDPIGHSLSPLLFNRWFAEYGVGGLYLPLLVRGGADELHDFLNRSTERPWLGLSGCSVTIPHKSSALAWAGGGADSMARGIGAANTLVFRYGFDGEGAPESVAAGDSTLATASSEVGPVGKGAAVTRRAAFNTDCYAAVDSICSALGCARAELSKLRFDILGAGGAARALVYGLREYGGSGTIFARNVEAARRLWGGGGFDVAHWDERGNGEGEVLINTTSIGMRSAMHGDVESSGGGIDASPMPVESLKGRRLVFDLIYNPPQTRLLHEAAQHGVLTLNGLDMFVRQAAVQLELWRGIEPEPVGLREWLAKAVR